MSDERVASIAEWRESHPGTWILRHNRHNHEPSLLFGSSTTISSLATGNRSPHEVANGFLTEASNLFGIDPAQFEPVTTRQRPTIRTPQSATYTIAFEQRIQGVPVEGPGVQVVLSGQKKLMAIISDHAKPPRKSPTEATVPEYVAVERGIDFYGATYPGRLGEVLNVDLVWVPDWALAIGDTTLCWKIDLVSFAGSRQGFPHRIFIDAALEQGKPVLDFSLVSNCRSNGAEGRPIPATVGGTVNANVREFPFAGFTQEPMKHLQVKEVGVNNWVFADAAGGFSLAGVPGTVDLEFPLHTEHLGYKDTVLDPTATSPDQVTGLSGGANSIVLNPTFTEGRTAAYNCYLAMQEFRQWLRDQGVTNFDASDLTAFVNQDPMSAPIDFGNAFFQWGATHGEIHFAMKNPSGSEENMAFSTVVAHEMGHWVNSGIGTWPAQGTLGNNGADEGLADAWAMYMYDEPIIGRNYDGLGNYLRNGDNTALLCENPIGGCASDPHYDGLPLMGSLWDIYSTIPQSTAETLLINILSTTGFGFVDERFRDIWLIEDDDDGDFSNGTPHFNAIETAYTDHGWPPFLANGYKVTHHPHPDTSDDSQSYAIGTILEPNDDLASFLTLNTQEIEYRELGGVSGFAPLTLVSGDAYTASIPNTAFVPTSPQVVEYRIHLQYTLGSSLIDQYYPEEGYFKFLVGESNRLFLNGFESPTGRDQGWTHVDLNNPLFDDWQRGLPGGSQGVSFGTPWYDPPILVGSTQIWGTDIAATWDGMYRANVDSYLQSPVIDASNMTNLKLRFDRWLSFAGPGDEATIWAVHPVNGRELLKLYDPVSANDVEWQDVVIDLDPLLTDETFRLRFKLKTDFGTNYGGWNIDNVEIIALGASPGGSSPSNTMTLRGDTSASVGMVPKFALTGGTPNAPFKVYYHTVWDRVNGWSHGGHTYDIELLPRNKVLSGTLGPNGNANIVLPQAANSSQIGNTYYFEVVANPASGVEDSNVQILTVWP